ncbi:protein-methionine-sulfoxide reductase catalytic subunit MsrP [Dongia soli]|uniref:Protein-methionine-sulfoxide reductase catalytic subunit MsrP n=1 Tax=Dongia soli TaxID=600628 RepID=A0ABU5E4T5_9PROT|nr:protein-methionine-sulfoxide reductase catalytic subunit MsrP [Dongia soli]MDY0881320.1 protein-methionine-sulfoxide reductase catalytic subunit MsrP [Dongia soli]
MLIRVPRGWEIAESQATPEAIYLRRRRFLSGMVAGGLVGSALPGLLMQSVRADDVDPSAGLYPVKPNPTYQLDGPMTPEQLASHYNNYYEFGDSKDIATAAQALPIRPWSVTLDGMVEKPQTIAIDDLLKAMPLEERLYRHRCVEAWSMAVPWSGFPLKALVAFARPSAGAKYLRFESFSNPDVAPGQTADWYPWPYIEGVTLEEAANELAFVSTGLYGKPLPKQNGAPIRLTLPWKYGFKSGKGIVRISFTDGRPHTFWEAIQSSEYGFWANVNPDVPHPRWSQASERDLGTGEQRPTKLFNGYAEQVAALYTNLQGEELYR